MHVTMVVGAVAWSGGLALFALSGWLPVGWAGFADGVGLTSAMGGLAFYGLGSLMVLLPVPARPTGMGWGPFDALFWASVPAVALASLAGWPLSWGMWTVLAVQGWEMATGADSEETEDGEAEEPEGWDPGDERYVHHPSVKLLMTLGCLASAYLMVGMLREGWWFLWTC